MAIGVVTVPDQGYQRREGNLLDAATSAMALYNLPQSMKLAMQQKQLQNQGMQLANTGAGLANTQAGYDVNARKALMIIQGDVNNTQPPQAKRAPYVSPPQSSLFPATNADMPPDDSPANPRSGPPAYGPPTASSPGSLDNAGESHYANVNENSSRGGMSNDINVKGTSAQDLASMGVDPYNTQSFFHDSQSKTLTQGPQNQGPAMANGTSARPSPMLPPTIPGSTQGGGPTDSPFNSPPFSSKGTSFNSGETADNASSLPREDSMPVVMNPQDHAKLPAGATYKDAAGNIRQKTQVA